MAWERPRRRSRRAYCLLQTSWTIHGACLPHGARGRSGFHSSRRGKARAPGNRLLHKEGPARTGAGGRLDRSRQLRTSGNRRSQGLLRQGNSHLVRSELSPRCPESRSPTWVRISSPSSVGACPTTGPSVTTPRRCSSRPSSKPRDIPARSTGHRAGSMSEPPKGAGATTGTGSMTSRKGCLAPAPAKRLETHPQSLKSTGSNRNARADSTA